MQLMMAAVVGDQDEDEDRAAVVVGKDEGKEGIVGETDEEVRTVTHVLGEGTVDSVDGNQTVAELACLHAAAAVAEQMPWLLHSHELVDPSI